MNRTPRFIDAGDRYHARARWLVTHISGPFVTTGAVLIEVGNALARMRWRQLGIALIADVRASEDVEIVPLSPGLFARAIELYSARPDKEWGLTDCISFVVMRDRGITKALAADQHFVQAGFRALLRES